MRVRGHNPFLQTYGLPAFEGAALASTPATHSALKLTLANHADDERSPTEAIVLDGESYFLELALRRRVGERLELGLEVPILRHSSGVLDNAIEAWHDLVGLSNASRDGPSNLLEFRYAGPGGAELRRATSTTGLGDTRLSAGIALNDPADGPVRITLRLHAELPTGDADRLLGNGATDLALGLHVDHELGGKFRLTGFAGAAWPGDGASFDGARRERVGFGGAGLAWRWSQSLEWIAQVRASEPLIRSGLDALGGSAVQVTLGAHLERPGARGHWTVGLVEDVFSDSTADVAFHVGYATRHGR